MKCGFYIHPRMPQKHAEPGIKVAFQLRHGNMSAAISCLYRIRQFRIIQIRNLIILHHPVNCFSFFLCHIIRIFLQISGCLLHWN